MVGSICDSHLERERERVMKGKQRKVCVTGGTGYLGSWMIKRLLQDGFSVNATVRLHADRKRDISYITNLPGATERLKIFDGDLDKPEAFVAAIEGCSGVFHMAHPLDFVGEETEEAKLKRVINGLQGILHACAHAKTVRRVVHTSSISSALFSTTANQNGVVDETSWTDADFIRSLNMFGGSYIVTKVLAEKEAFALADKLKIHLLSVLPTWITGPFICPNIPESVKTTMALIFGDDTKYGLIKESSFVHVDDVARAHIHLLEHPEAKGRYIVNRVELKIEELCDFLSANYPQYKMPSPDSWKDAVAIKMSGLSTKKLEETGFKYVNGLEEMFNHAINSCKEKGFL